LRYLQRNGDANADYYICHESDEILMQGKAESLIAEIKFIID
jgi:hypothetical protein